MLSPETGLFTQSSINLVFLRKVLRLHSTVRTSFCMQFDKVGYGFLRQALEVRERAHAAESREWAGGGENSPSPQQASCSNPCPSFSNCTQNDVTTVLFSLSTFHKNHEYTTLKYHLLSLYSYLVHFLIWLDLALDVAQQQLYQKEFLSEYLFQIWKL